MSNQPIKAEVGALIGGLTFVTLAIIGLSNAEFFGLNPQDIKPYSLVSIIAAAGIGGGVGGWIGSKV